MKKTILYFLIGLISIFMLAACADNSATEAEEASEQSGTGLPPVSELELMEQEGEEHHHMYQSDYFDEQGFFKDINTDDYITMADYSAIEVPQEQLTVTDEALQAELNSVLAGLGIVLSSPEELTDAYMAQISGGQFSTVDAFKTLLKEEMLSEQKRQYLSQALIDIATFNELPPAMLDYYIAITEDTIYHDALAYGMTVDGLLIEMGYAGLEDYLEKEKIIFENQVKNTLIIQYIAEQEAIEVEPADIDSFFNGTDWSGYKESWGENYIKALVLADLAYNSFID